MEIPICRFCLDEHNKEENKLVAPCHCIGSVKYVHIKCLIRWRAVGPIEFANFCQLCRFPYTAGNFMFETIPLERGLRFQFLICPYLFSFSSKYFTFVYSGIFLNNYTIATNLIQFHQIVLHGIYFYFLLTNLHINNRVSYRSRLFIFPRIFIMLAHIFFWYIATNTENIFLLYLVDAFLPFYWHTHMRILTEINEGLDT
jgi:hypothetical protein